MKNRIKLVLMFTAGFVSGLFIRLGVEVINLRPRSPGGEALFPLLIVLLMTAGYFIGRETKVHGDLREPKWAIYFDGYIKGLNGGIGIAWRIHKLYARLAPALTKFKKPPGR